MVSVGDANSGEKERECDETPRWPRSPDGRIRGEVVAAPAGPANPGGGVGRGGPFLKKRGGHSPRPRVAVAAGEAMAEELRAVGVDINFAPVLDVDSNPENPVIGDRALSSDPESVAELGIAFSRGMLSRGVLPVGKHFPGHGNTASDSPM